jgi:UDP-glucose 4-epimerase
MSWLVTGGAGYIGAHVVQAFCAAGIETVVLDNLSTGQKNFLPDHVPLVQISIADAEAVNCLFGEHQIDGVVHLAGYKSAGQSILFPLDAYKQNVTGTIVLLEAMQKATVDRLVFSSSAAVYGTPTVARVTEATATAPESPYGETKLIGEWLIANQAAVTQLAHTSLRYFNVVGSATNQIFDNSANNLFPKIFKSICQKENPSIFGDDYETFDGTCVRDYVHVADVAAAHVQAALSLTNSIDLQPVYNLGSGEGTSVKQIMDAVKAVTQIDFVPTVLPRRLGDPAQIVADGTLAARDLDWSNTYSIEAMVATAWHAYNSKQITSFQIRQK